MSKKTLSAFVGCGMLASSLLSGCTTSPRIAAFLLTDKSTSALEEKQFAEIAKKSCHSFAKGLQPTDYAQQITVSGSAPKASDLAQVRDPKIYHHHCQPIKPPDAASIPKGTFSCPAWALANDLSRRQPAASLPVLYLSVIQTNELERPCPHVWRKLAADAHERGGKLVIAGSSIGNPQNPALNNSFNQILWKNLRDSPSIVFCEEKSVQSCIEQAFQDIRQSQRGTSQ